MADDSDNDIMSDSSVDDIDDGDLEIDSIYDSHDSTVDSDSDVSVDLPAPPRKRPRKLSSSSTASAPTTGGEDPSTSSSSTEHDLLVKFKSKIVTGNNGHRWSTQPAIRRTSRTPMRNLLPAFNYSTPTVSYVNPSSLRCFEDFTDEILNEILKHTNTHIAMKAQKYGTKKATVDQATFSELSALIGILIFSGAKGDNDVTTKEMFSIKYGPALYRAAMSERRFSFLLRCLRFDDHTTYAHKPK